MDLSAKGRLFDVLVHMCLRAVVGVTVCGSEVESMLILSVSLKSDEGLGAGWVHFDRGEGLSVHMESSRFHRFITLIIRCNRWKYLICNR